MPDWLRKRFPMQTIIEDDNSDGFMGPAGFQGARCDNGSALGDEGGQRGHKGDVPKKGGKKIEGDEGGFAKTWDGSSKRKAAQNGWAKGWPRRPPGASGKKPTGVRH